MHRSLILALAASGHTSPIAHCKSLQNYIIGIIYNIFETKWRLHTVSCFTTVLESTPLLLGPLVIATHRTWARTRRIARSAALGRCKETKVLLIEAPHMGCRWLWLWLLLLLIFSLFLFFLLFLLFPLLFWRCCCLCSVLSLSAYFVLWYQPKNEAVKSSLRVFVGLIQRIPRVQLQYSIF